LQTSIHHYFYAVVCLHLFKLYTQFCSFIPRRGVSKIAANNGTGHDRENYIHSHSEAMFSFPLATPITSPLILRMRYRIAKSLE